MRKQKTTFSKFDSHWVLYTSGLVLNSSKPSKYMIRNMTSDIHTNCLIDMSKTREANSGFTSNEWYSIVDVTVYQLLLDYFMLKINLFYS